MQHSRDADGLVSSTVSQVHAGCTKAVTTTSTPVLPVLVHSGHDRDMAGIGVFQRRASATRRCCIQASAVTSTRDRFHAVDAAERTIAKATEESSGSGSATPVPDECNRPQAAASRYARRAVRIAWKGRSARDARRAFQEKRPQARHPLQAGQTRAPRLYP
jgi:hypothetical protein